MLKPINSMLDQFQLAGAPSLPALALRGLKLQGEKDSAQALVELLKQDVSLYGKVLGSSRQQGFSRPFDPVSVLSAVGKERVYSLIEQAALQSCFSKMKPGRLKFLNKHWLDSCASVALASELAKKLHKDKNNVAGFCARFLNFGELVLEGLYSRQYRQLHKQAKTKAELFKAEVQQFGCSHAELSAALFRRWGLDGFTCDALRYHDQDLEKVLDSSNLVKICWLTNFMGSQLQDGGDLEEGIVDASKKLFNLSLGDINDVYIKAQVHFNSLSLVDGSKSDVDVQAEINEHMQNTSLFNAVRPDFSLGVNESTTTSGNVLGETLSLLFGIESSIVFIHDSESNSLKVYLSALQRSDVSELEIQCQEGRSVVSKSFLSGKKTLGIEYDINMAVVDRQILSALGTPAMVCEPLIADNGAIGVLVLGVQQSQSILYSKQVKHLELLKMELAKALSQANSNDSYTQQMIYQQRINDAIHEANNPLSIIKNYLQLLSIKQAGEESVLEDIHIIKTEIDRVGSILQNLKNARAIEDKPREVQINTILVSLNKVFKASIFSAKSISVKLDLDSELPLILANENALKQVFTNLLKNAAEALPESGTIKVETRGNIFMREMHYIQVLISDDGPGIPASAMDTLFLPGNSSKGGAHTGLGLAITKNLVENMHGQISCQSSKNGTRFSLLFPKNKRLE